MSPHKTPQHNERGPCIIYGELYTVLLKVGMKMFKEYKLEINCSQGILCTNFMDRTLLSNRDFPPNTNAMGVNRFTQEKLFHEEMS